MPLSENRHFCNSSQDNLQKQDARPIKSRQTLFYIIFVQEKTSKILVMHESQESLTRRKKKEIKQIAVTVSFCSE